MKNRQILKQILGISFLLLSLLIIPLIDVNLDESRRDTTISNRLRNSGFWELDEILIDGNSGWASAASLDWCFFEYGYYIIENVTFRCLDGDGNSLRIVDSDVPFIIRNCTFTLSGTDSNNQDAGLELNSVENGVITQNYFINNKQNGLFLTGGDGTESINNIIINNTVKNNLKYGIYLHESDDNNMLNNNVKNNSHGIRLHSSVDNTAEENKVQNNTIGFSFQYGDANIITNNTVFDNANDGFYIYRSNLNTISENLISSNSRYGVYAFDTSVNNLIFTNTFEQNDVHAFDTSSGNDWDNGSIGNYWDNYTGTDIDGDGIGEIPYFIPGGIGEQDNYPIWPFLAPIYINGSATGVGAHNWTWASSQLWCSGSGYSYDPYIIEGYKIDGNRTEGISCIEIVDSNTYFEIKGCTLYNGGNLMPDAGIKLNNTQNGKLLNNNCSKNIQGINLLDNCTNNLISGNILNENFVSGIHFQNNCSYNIIENNEIDGGSISTMVGIWFLHNNSHNDINMNNLTNHGEGIRLWDNEDSNIIKNNNICNNRYEGINIKTNSDKNEILNNIVHDNGHSGPDPGISIDDECEDTTILNNSIYNNGRDGIYIISFCHRTLISNNSISDNLRYGILFTVHNKNITISNNIINDNDDHGIYISGFEGENPKVVNNNIFDNLGIGIYITPDCDDAQIIGNNISNNHEEGIFLDECERCLVIDNYVFSNGLGTLNGISLRDCDFSQVMENILIDNGFAGISISSSDNCRCINNIAKKNQIGMQFMSSANIIVQDNIINLNTITGMIIMTTVNNISVIANSIKNSPNYGMQIAGCYNSIFSENLLSDNGDGIYITVDSDNNNFTLNYIKDNTGYGIRIDAGCDTNLFYKNYLSNNQINALDSGTSTLWNNSYIGNYWSNYTGVDLDNDGIGDIPQDINGLSNAKDFLPIYNNMPSIYIDEHTDYTWQWISQFYWCDGSGTVKDPYIIENKVINSIWSSNRIEIRNSKSYFIIKDCSLSNNGSGYSGILLYNTINGKIINCNSELNEIGIKLEGCNNINISGNNINNNLRGISLANSASNIILGNNINLNGIGLELWQSNYNFIKNNVLTDNEICILEIDCVGNIFENNDCGPKPLEEIFINIIDQIYSSQGFNITFYLFNATLDPIDTAAFQMWWDGQDVTNDTLNLGGGMYFVSLEPITVEEGDDPILLNMSISGTGYVDKYFETDISVRPCELIDLLFFEIIDQIYTEDYFNLTFYITNATGDGIDFATIEIIWDGTDVSADVQNLGNGLYFISLESKLVSPGDDPIILDITIEATGYQDLNYQMEIAVDPESVSKGITGGGGEFPIIPIIIGVSIGGSVSAIGVYLLLKKRKLGKVVVGETAENP